MSWADGRRADGGLDAACEAAMRQLEMKDYTATLRRYRTKEIRACGIAFWDKEKHYEVICRTI